MLQNFKSVKDPFEVEIPHWNAFEVEIPNWNPFEVEIPHCGFPNSRRGLVLPDTYSGLKFELRAFSSLKVDRLGRKTGKKKEKITSKSIGVNEHNHKKCG